MTLILYYHPFSSFCQKVLVALYEKEVEFEPYEVDLRNERSRAELAAIWPFAKFPVLHDVNRGVTVPESTLIVEYVDGLSAKGPRLLPAEPSAARNVRLLDRILDNYVELPVQKIVADRFRPAGRGDPHGVEEARATLATTYAVLERNLGNSEWLGGSEFNLADCGAAPALFYAAKVSPFSDRPKLSAYLRRLMDRPSFRRCLDEARSFRPNFPAAAGDGKWPDEQTVAAPEPDRIAF
jgi:glutathione S-transferase